MIKAVIGSLSAGALVLAPCMAAPAAVVAKGPEASERSPVQNYKDMVLATCVASAYKADKGAAVDAGSSASALRDWTAYDLEKSPDAVRSLVESYLARDYRNPLVEAEIKGVGFELLKCLDLYHGKALDAQARRLVVEPGHKNRRGLAPAGPRPRE